MERTFEIVPQEVLWSIWKNHKTLWSLPLPIVTWPSRTWPYTMTTSINQTLHQIANLLPNLTLLPILTLLPNFGGFHRTLQRVRLANRERLLLRTPCPVLFGTCICSYVETILSWTCHVFGPFEFRTSLGTSILLQNLTFSLMQYIAPCEFLFFPKFQSSSFRQVISRSIYDQICCISGYMRDMLKDA